MRPPPRIRAEYYERFWAALSPNYKGDVNCILEFTGRLDERRLQHAFLAALAQEPMWSYRFVAHWWIPYWQIIPRVERPDLMRIENCADADAFRAAWERILDTQAEAAVRLHVLRTPSHDKVVVRVNHSLADVAAARILVDAIRDNYRRAAVPPDQDAPLTRRTAAMLRPLQKVRGRLKFFGEFIQFLKRAASGKGFTLPAPTRDDPVAPPQFLHYPEGATAQLAARALRDRATNVMVVLAATYIALRDLVSLSEEAVWPIILPVDLRRYLPLDQQPAPACLLTGQAAIWVDPQKSADLAAVLEQVRTQLGQQRGPHFGLVQSPLTMDIPLLRQLVFWTPFRTMSRSMRRMQANHTLTPPMVVTDMGEISRPGEDWGDASIVHGFFTPGTYRNPFVIVGMTVCGTRLTLSIGAGPRTFVRRLVERIDFHLSRYAGWDPADVDRPPLSLFSTV